MTLYTDPPWTNSFLNPESIEHKFNELNDHLFFLVRDGSFKLLQFKDQKKYKTPYLNLVGVTILFIGPVFMQSTKRTVRKKILSKLE